MFVLWFKLANWVHLPAVRADAGLGRKIWVERWSVTEEVNKALLILAVSDLDSIDDAWRWCTLLSPPQVCVKYREKLTAAPTTTLLGELIEQKSRPSNWSVLCGSKTHTNWSKNKMKLKMYQSENWLYALDCWWIAQHIREVKLKHMQRLTNGFAHRRCEGTVGRQ